MRRPLPAVRPNPREECVASRRGGPARAGTLRALVALGVLALTAATLGVPSPAQAQTTPAPPSAPGGAAAATDATIAKLSEQADALSGQYFAALGQLAEIQHRIDDIESRLPHLTDQVAELRALSQDRAVAAYKRSGNGLASVMGAADPLQAARRIMWLDRLNARDDVLAEELRATSAKLVSQRSELREAQASADAALSDVRAQGQSIDALLADAQERRRVETTAATTPATEPATTPATETTAPVVAPTPTTAPAPASTTTTTAPKAVPPPAPPTYVPTSGTHPHHDDPFLVCTRTRESSGNYAAYNPAGPYMGAYQFLQTTWNSAANHAGRTNLIGVPPNTASQYDQDDVAWALYQWQGSAPWGGMCDPP